MIEAPTAPTVVKVGGSLLDWPELPERLADDLSRRPGPLILVVGGGRAADYVRHLDRAHGLGEERSHRLALRALDLTACIVAELLGLDVAEEVAELTDRAATAGPILLAPRRFLDDEDRTSSAPLPHDWRVTTDSIAARLAERLRASQLVLLKSVGLPRGVHRAEAARLGLVDPAFPAVAAQVARVRFRNLRDPAGADDLLP